MKASRRKQPARATAAFIDRLLRQMSLEEKLRQLAIGSPNGNLRLGIPTLRCGEVLHGVCHPGCTSFPQALALAATWDPGLIEEMAAVIAREARAVGIQIAFSPMLALGRDARWGRIEESYGEDPCLVSRMGVAFVQGLQGRGPRRFDREHIMATPKHFVADGEPLRGLNGSAVDITMAGLRELHLRPFEAVVKEAGAGAIMPAHHALNRVPCHANRWLLRDLLADEWGFDGLIVSDCLDIPKLWAFGEAGYSWMHSQHRVARDTTEAGVLALRAGVDMELGGDWNGMCYGRKMLEAIERGEVPDGRKLVHRAARNVLLAKLRLGLFDDGRPVQPEDDPLGQAGSTGIRDGKEEYALRVAAGEVPIAPAPQAKPEDVLNRPEHDALARKVAQRAIVLLKNEGPLLPLDPARLKRIAVIGPNATERVLGGYSTGQPKYYVSVLDGIREACAGKAEVVHARGCSITIEDGTRTLGGWGKPVDDDRSGIPAAVEAARGAGVAVVVLGGNRGTCGENTDADSIDFTAAQQQLIRDVHATGTPVVLVTLHGRPNNLEWAAENVPAILEGFYLGQECGRALADVLFGVVNPGGKLPVAIPRSTGQIPCLYNALWSSGIPLYAGNSRRSEPLFPFGFGLSYTRFEIRDLALSRPRMRAGGRTLLSATVTNTGDRDGDEVVQMYITDDFASLVRPMRELRAFKRLALKPGESARVTFPITFEELKFWSDGQWIVEPGTFQVWIGNSSACQDRIELTVME